MIERVNGGGRWAASVADPDLRDTQPPLDLAMSDEALMTRVRARDDEALALLHDRHQRAAFTLAHRILRDVGQAEDVVQEAFLAVWRHAERFDPERGRLRAWLLTIVHHRAINQLRGRPAPGQVAELQEGIVDGRQPEVWQQAYAAIRQADIHAALHRLPHEQRRAVELAFFTGLSHGEIAERLGLPLGTVKSRTRLAYRKLQTILARYAA
jgi:RNA polymerase sigma-70 factor, ECF subfamily